MARRTVYTEKLGRALCTQIESGVTLRLAARTQGIARATLYNWLAAGSEGREPYASFRARLERAQAACDAQRTSCLSDDWQAAAWWLSRRFPKRWGSKVRVHIVETAEKMTDAELEAQLKRLGYVRRDRLQ